MSFFAVGVVFESVRGLNSSERLVLLCLAEHAGIEEDAAAAWPKVRTIASRCELHAETVRRAIRGLESKGLVEVVPRSRDDGSRTSNLYALRFLEAPPRIAGSPPPQPVGDPPPQSAGTPPHANRGALKGKKNRQSNRQMKQRAEDVPVPAVLTTPAFLEKWAEWLDYRRKVKKVPVSVKAARMQLRDCAEVGPEAACEAIDTAMRGDWQGLFPNGGKSKRPAATEMPEMHNFGWGQR